MGNVFTSATAIESLIIEEAPVITSVSIPACIQQDSIPNIANPKSY